MVFTNNHKVYRNLWIVICVTIAVLVATHLNLRLNLGRGRRQHYIDILLNGYDEELTFRRWCLRTVDLLSFLFASGIPGSIVSAFIYFVVRVIDGTPRAAMWRSSAKMKRNVVFFVCFYSFIMTGILNGVLLKLKKGGDRERTVVLLQMYQYVLTGVMSIGLRRSYVDHAVIMTAYASPFFSFAFCDNGDIDLRGCINLGVFAIFVCGFIFMMAYRYPDQDSKCMSDITISEEPLWSIVVNWFMAVPQPLQPRYVEAARRVADVQAERVADVQAERVAKAEAERVAKAEAEACCRRRGRGVLQMQRQRRVADAEAEA